MTPDIESTAKKGRTLFESGDYYCAESVLLAIAEHQGVQSELLTQVATGFCSGMARTGGLCGAMTGGVMGLGVVNGRRAPGDDRSANYDATQRFIASFEARFGSKTCYELTGGCDFNTPEGQAKFRDENVMAHCLDYGENAIRLALHAAQDVTEDGGAG